VSEAPAPSAAIDLGGLALADAEVDLLRTAFENYGFVFEPVMVDETGRTREHGTKPSENVQVTFRHVDGRIEMLGVLDHSGDKLGLDEMGFTIGIFAPESQAWLVEEVEAMLATPSLAAEATMLFTHVTLSLAYAAHGSESLELLVE
jgi:hypothetical protein